MMNYQIRVGSKKYGLSPDYQDVLKEALRCDHQVFCTCRFPNPLMRVENSQSECKLTPISDRLLLQHKSNCDFSEQTLESVDLSVLERLWSTAQLNIWTPKMAAKRNNRSVKKIIENASKFLTVGEGGLSEAISVPEKGLKLKRQNLTLGVIRKVDNEAYQLHYVDQVFKVPTDKKAIFKKIKQFSQKKNIKVFCLVDDKGGFYDFLVTERNCLPLNTNEIEGSLVSIMKRVQQKKRFFVSYKREIVLF